MIDAAAAVISGGTEPVPPTHFASAQPARQTLRMSPAMAAGVSKTL